MSVTPLIITVKIEEVTPIGTYIIDAFERDLTQINGKYKKYDADYLTQLKADHTAVNELINPLLLTGKIAKLTQDIYQQQSLIPPILDLVEGYINIAKNLTVAPAYFNISAVRKSNNNNDVEGIVDNLKTLLQVINDNTTALTAEGLTAADITALQSIQTTISSTKAARGLLEAEKTGLIDDNHIAINDFWASLVDICDKGKRVFKTTAPVKLPDYTMTSIKLKVRKAQQLNGLKGKVQSNGKPVASATIELLPLAAGRRRTNTTKKDGLYQIGGVTAGPYLANITAKNYQPLRLEITIEDGKLLEKDFELVGV